jgi:O-antigen ligase
MAPLATVLCIGFIIYALWLERADSKEFSSALWIPQIWMLILGSRYISLWLQIRRDISNQDALLEGSPTDMVVFFLLMAFGLVVLVRRNTHWGQVIFSNKWIALFFVFALLSVFWSDFPFISFRRWIKSLGNIIMALVILSETRPYEACVLALRRMGIFLLPLSVLFIKYYPALGRSTQRWTWQPMYHGATLNKNSLGELCFLCGMAFVWFALTRRGDSSSAVTRSRKILNYVLLGMTIWLLQMANSATSKVCFAMAVVIFLASRLRSFTNSPGRIVRVGVAGIVLLLIFQAFFGMEALYGLLRRDSTLTTRVPMWDDLMSQATSPLVGVGFEVFWLGPRLDRIWAAWGPLNQAHNGYVEMYLNLGIIGLGLLIGGILSSIFKICKDLKVDYSTSILRLAFVLTVTFYNWTEATFRGINNTWLVLLLGGLALTRQEVKQLSPMFRRVKSPLMNRTTLASAPQGFRR